jgi:hypothetical protein
MVTKTEKEVRISRADWESLKRNPAFAELIELLEDQEALERAKSESGSDLTLDQYLDKRGIRNRP